MEAGAEEGRVGQGLELAQEIPVPLLGGKVVEPDREEAAEGLAPAHTGGEIARVADPGGGGVAVVAMLPVVEGQLHEAGKRGVGLPVR